MEWLARIGSLRLLSAIPGKSFRKCLLKKLLNFDSFKYRFPTAPHHVLPIVSRVAPVSWILIFVSLHDMGFGSGNFSDFHGVNFCKRSSSNGRQTACS